MFPRYIVNKIINIPILVNDIKDKVVWKFVSDEKFSVKQSLGQIMIKFFSIIGLIVKSYFETEKDPQN